MKNQIIKIALMVTMVLIPLQAFGGDYMPQFPMIRTRHVPLWDEIFWRGVKEKETKATYVYLISLGPSIHRTKS